MCCWESWSSFREPHPVWRKFMAWLYWVGHCASFHQVDHFSGIAQGTLCRQGKRGQGVLGTVSLAMYDILVLGMGHLRPGGEIYFPSTSNEVTEVQREFFQHARLPGVVGAVDGCLVQTPLPRYEQRHHEDGEVDQPVAFFCYKKRCVQFGRALEVRACVVVMIKHTICI
jgi:hypothetical protein